MSLRIPGRTKVLFWKISPISWDFLSKIILLNNQIKAAQGGDFRASINMKQILRTVNRQVAFELRLGYLMPIFVGLGILLNSQIANASALQVRDFAPGPIHAQQYADYSRDTIDFQFAPLDPAIIEIAITDLDLDKDGLDNPLVTPTPDLLQPSPTATPGFASPTPTSLIGLPTLPLPTLPPLLPTLPPIIPTLLPVVPTVAAPIIDLIPTIVPPLPPIVPCIPVPFVQSCN
jgi:hypothetical protein